MSKWEKVRLGDVAIINPAKPQEFYQSGNIPISFIPMTLVSEDGVANTSNPKLLNELNKGYTYFIEGDVLFAKITPCMENGKVAIAKKLINGLGAGSTEFHVLRPIQDKISSEWIYLFLRNKNTRLLAERNMTGSAGQKRVPRTFLESVLIPLPPLDDQKRIARELDTVSELLALRKQQLSELDQLIESVYYEMFGDPGQNEKEWELSPLVSISQSGLSYGSGVSATEYDGKTRYIRITDINDDGTLNNSVASPEFVDERFLLNDGDILFARSGATVGKTLRYRTEFGRAIFAGYLIRLIPDQTKVLPDYIYYFTKTAYYNNFIERNKKTVAQPNINAQQYGELKIILPPLSEQRKFTTYVAQIESQKSLVRQSVDETQRLFDSLMSQYFDD